MTRRWSSNLGVEQQPVLIKNIIGAEDPRNLGQDLTIKLHGKAPSLLRRGKTKVLRLVSWSATSLFSQGAFENLVMES